VVAGWWIVAVGIASCTSEARDTTDSVARTTAEPGALSLDEVAGTWNMRAFPENARDGVTSYVLEAKADTGGWALVYPNRPPIPVRVWVQGDSIITEAGYESVRHPGVQEAARTVFRLQGDSLIGASIVRLTGGGPDSIVRRRTSGTRAR
jgi:hypothetical protein